MSAFERPLLKMRYFHTSHQRQLKHFIDECQSVDSVRELKTFSSDVREFCQGLHMHHTIEDTHIFPKLSRKFDISHLEKHHKQLHKILEEFEAMAVKLREVKQLDDYNADSTLRLVEDVNKLVCEHEAAEEAVLDPQLLKQHFTEREIYNFIS